MKKVEVIDYLKGYSIITIVLMHLIQNYLKVPGIINKASSLGGAGVHVFIFCSGFGLYYSYLRNKTNIKDFFNKRFFKVYIPYIIVVLISSLIPFMYGNYDRFIAILSHVFLFKMFFENYETSFGIQLWFISTIIQFYIVFNIIVYLKNKINSNKKFITVSCFISILWWIVTSVIGKSEIRIWSSFFLQYVWEFSLGMLLAERLYINNRNVKLECKSKLLVISFVGLFLYGFLGIKGGTLKLFNDVPSLFGYGGLALFIYSLNIKIINKTMLKISNYSYELYLVHILIYSCVFKMFDNRISQILTGIIAIVLSIIIAKAYHILLNKFNNINMNLNNEINIKEAA